MSKNKSPRKRYAEILTRDVLYKEYIENKNSICDIADMLNVSRMQVSRYLKKYSILSRSMAESRALALSRGKACGKGKTYRSIEYKNHGFFKEWTKDMAYVLGVLYTDGCVYPGKGNSLGLQTTASTPRIALSQKQPEILEKVLKLIGCNATIYNRERRVTQTTVSGPVFFFVLNSHEMFEDLVSLGVTPKKSMSLQYPSKLPQKFVGHFLRGCWDGDGSIVLKGQAITAKLVSGSRDFVTGIKVAITENTGIEGSIYTGKEGKNYTLSYCGGNARTVLSFIYADSNEENRLTRKYQKYITHLQLISGK